MEDRESSLTNGLSVLGQSIPPPPPPSLMDQANASEVPLAGQKVALTPPPAVPGAMVGKPPIQAPPGGDWESSSGVMPAGTGGSPNLGVRPPVGPPMAGMGPAVDPAVAAQQKAEKTAKNIQAVTAAHGDNYTTDGLIDKQTLMNDQRLRLEDDDTKKRLADTIDAANEHIKQSRTLGNKLSYDTSGKEYWDDLSTGGKILRVLGGILTLGGSEHYIASAIKKQVATDQANINTENNVYAEALALGKTKEEAASADHAAHEHTYLQGLHKIQAMYPSNKELHAKIAALTAGLQKDTSTAILANYHQGQQTSLEQQRLGIEREKLGMMKMDAKKQGLDRVVRDENGKVIGMSDTPEQKKEIQTRMAAYKTIDSFAPKVEKYSWTDKLGGEARQNARSVYGEILQSLDAFRAAKPSVENSRVVDVLKTMLPNPDDLTTTPDAFKAGYRNLKAMLGREMAMGQLQSGVM